MPRPSGNPDTFTGGGQSRFNPPSGRYQVIKAAYHVNQVFKDGKPATAKTGEAIPPALALQLILHEADGHGNLIPLRNPDEPFLLELKMGDALSKGVHPGYARDIEDNDPQDLGSDHTVFGNTIFIPADLAGHSDVFAKNSSYGLFTKSLLTAGFPPLAINLMWAPGFEGLQFELAQMDKVEANNFFGSKKNRGFILTLDGPYKVATKIYKHDTTSAGTPGTPPVSLDEMAANVLKDLAAAYSGKRLAVPTGAAANSVAKLHYPQAQLPNILKKLSDKNFLETALPGIALEAGGALTFPAAAEKSSGV